MPETERIDEDRTLKALESLSEAAVSGANELNMLNDELTTMRRRRRRGWTWRRIMNTSSLSNPITGVQSVISKLLRTSNIFRRSLARALHREDAGMDEIVRLTGRRS